MLYVTGVYLRDITNTVSPVWRLTVSHLSLFSSSCEKWNCLGAKITRLRKIGSAPILHERFACIEISGVPLDVVLSTSTWHQHFIGEAWTGNSARRFMLRKEQCRQGLLTGGVCPLSCFSRLFFLLFFRCDLHRNAERVKCYALISFAWNVVWSQIRCVCVWFLLVLVHWCKAICK